MLCIAVQWHMINNQTTRLAGGELILTHHIENCPRHKATYLLIQCISLIPQTGSNSCHCGGGQCVSSPVSGQSASTGRWLAGIPTGGRPFRIGLKLRGDEPGECAGERTGRRAGVTSGCGRGCASGEGLRGYLRGVDQTGRSVLWTPWGSAGPLGAGMLISDWPRALPEVSSKRSRVSCMRGHTGKCVWVTMIMLHQEMNNLGNVWWTLLTNWHCKSGLSF